MNKKKPKTSDEPMMLRDIAPAYSTPAEENMIRTQIYLTRAEHEFLQQEGSRRGEPMAAVIRSLIDEKMAIPAEAWLNNPMLEETPEVAGWEGHEDGAINHDHYVYGCAKKYEKKNGEWVLLPTGDK